MAKKIWNRSETLLILTFTLALTDVIYGKSIEEIASSTITIKMLDETKSLMSKATEMETLNLQNLHIDEEPSDDTNKENSDVEMVDADLKYEVEILQPGRMQKENIEIEEQFKAPSIIFDTDEFVEENIEVNSETVQPGHVAVTIAFCAFALASVGMYAGMMIWRTRRRYGMRQRLMTEDDFSEGLNEPRPF